MGDDIGPGLSFMAVCFDSCSTNVVQLSNQNPYFYQFRCHHPLITQRRRKYESVSDFFWPHCEFCVLYDDYDKGSHTLRMYQQQLIMCALYRGQ